MNVEVHNNEASFQPMLVELVAAMGEGLGLVAMMQRLLDTFTRVLACHAALFYQPTAEPDSLLLVSASQELAHLVGQTRWAMGEGAVGLAAQRREAILQQEAPFGAASSSPGAEEAPFQSQLAIPLLARDGSLLGVIVLHAVASRILSEQHQVLSAQVAQLAVGIIAYSRRMEQAAQSRQRLTHLAELSQMISAGADLGLDDFIQRIAELTVALLGCDLTVALLFQRNSGQLSVAGVFPQVNKRTLPRRPIPFEQQDRAGLSAQGGVGLERFDPLRDATYRSLLSVPLMVGAEFFGILNCYTHIQRPATAEEQALLQTIANQTAIAIKLSVLSDVMAEKQRAEEFMAELMEGSYTEEQALWQRASVLGLDLARGHVVVLIDLVAPDDQVAGEAGSGSNRISKELSRRLLQLFPASLIAGQANRLTCLLNVSHSPSSAQLTSGLRELVQQMRSTYEVFMGVSTPCLHLAEYRRGFIEASEALQMGRSRQREGGVTHFNDLGVYRYLYKIAQAAPSENVPDQYQHFASKLAN